MRRFARSPSVPVLLRRRPRQKSFTERCKTLKNLEVREEIEEGGLNVTPTVTPMIQTNQGKRRSATVSPFQVEWLKK